MSTKAKDFFQNNPDLVRVREGIKELEALGWKNESTMLCGGIGTTDISDSYKFSHITYDKDSKVLYKRYVKFKDPKAEDGTISLEVINYNEEGQINYYLTQAELQALQKAFTLININTPKETNNDR